VPHVARLTRGALWTFRWHQAPNDSKVLARVHLTVLKVLAAKFLQECTGKRRMEKNEADSCGSCSNAQTWCKERRGTKCK